MSALAQCRDGRGIWLNALRSQSPKNYRGSHPQMQSVMLIDPPGRYSASTKQWEDFLARMKALPDQENVQVQAAIQEAQDVLKSRAEPHQKDKRNT